MRLTDRTIELSIDMLVAALIGISLGLLATTLSHAYIVANTPVVTVQEVTHKAEPEKTLEKAPESPVEATDTEEVLEVIQEQEKGVVRRPARRRKPQPRRLDINLDSNDPLEGI